MILLTLSPSNALQMLNGKPIVLPFKVPLGTAYIYVAKSRNQANRLLRLPDSQYEWHIAEEAVSNGWVVLQNTFHFDGLVVAKCEITASKIWGTDWASKVSRPLYYVTFTALTVFDKPMELKEFQSATELDRKYRAYAKVGCKVGTYRVVPKENYADLGIARLTRAPSRWQAVEVGK